MSHSIVRLHNLRNKRVLLRVDFNVPVFRGKLDEAEAFRIHAAVPTIEYLLKKGASVIILSHRGRPKGKKVAALSLKPAARYLSKILPPPQPSPSRGREKGGGTRGGKVGFGLSAAKKIRRGQTVMLENLRFDPREEKSDKTFAQELASLGDIFVQDGFAVVHRKGASITELPKLLPSYTGLLLEKEVKALSRILKPKKPFVAVIGGAKLETKVPVIEKLAPKAGAVLIGGAIASVFLAAKGYGIGSSLVGKEEIALAKKILQNKSIARKLVLPVDVVIADAKGKHAQVIEIPKHKSEIFPDIKSGQSAIYDVGPSTVRLFTDWIKRAQTIVWNGPMGKFEDAQFSHGTKAIAVMVAARSKGKAFGVAGGGETIQALYQTGMAEYMDHISTGGGAMLEFLAGKPLPGMKALAH